MVRSFAEPSVGDCGSCNMKPLEAVNQLVEVIRRKHLSRSTEASYSGWLRRYIGFLSDRRPNGATEAKIEAFLTARYLHQDALGVRSPLDSVA